MSPLLTVTDLRVSGGGRELVHGLDLTIVRDSRGRELSRTEAAGTPQARTIATTWHPEFNKPSVVSEPGRQTAYSYDAQGRLLSTTVQPQL